MKISFGILTHNEGSIILKLVDFICKYVMYEYEIIIVDDYSSDPETLDVLDKLNKYKNVSIFKNKLNNNFAQQKNYMNSLCSGDYIFNVDADEQLSENLISHLHLILDANPNIELFWLPRINIVNGLTDEHIKKWNWKVTKHAFTKEMVVNYPDYQGRLYRNIPSKIVWTNIVHERIKGAETFTYFPDHEDYCIRHVKDIKKQEQQNKFYGELNNG